jgi:hypothetical protein
MLSLTWLLLLLALSPLLLLMALLLALTWITTGLAATVGAGGGEQTVLAAQLTILRLKMPGRGAKHVHKHPTSYGECCAESVQDRKYRVQNVE